MLKYIVKRILWLIPILLGVSLIVFTLLYITPGDPALTLLGDGASPEAIAEMRESMGLNDPFLVRFFNFVKNAVLHGDLGTCYVTKQPVAALITQRFPNTLQLAATTAVLSVILGMIFGIISAIKPYSWFDNLTMSLALLGTSVPAFWLAMMMVLLFSLRLGWLPSSGVGGISHMIMPAIALGLSSVALIARMTRSSMLEVLSQDYITTARSKGLREWAVIMGHALKNALIPIITVVGTNFGTMLGGAIVIEACFGIPGVGKLMIDAIYARNYPVVQGGVLYTASAFCLVNLLVDILYSVADPRIRTK